MTVGAVAVVAILAIAASLLGGGSDLDKPIHTVRTGYLGTFTDITVEEIINYPFTRDQNGQSVVWDSSATYDGVMIVVARYSIQDGQGT